MGMSFSIRRRSVPLAEVGMPVSSPTVTCMQVRRLADRQRRCIVWTGGLITQLVGSEGAALSARPKLKRRQRQRQRPRRWICFPIITAAIMRNVFLSRGNGRQVPCSFSSSSSRLSNCRLQRAFVRVHNFLYINAPPN